MQSFKRLVVGKEKKPAVRLHEVLHLVSGGPNSWPRRILGHGSHFGQAGQPEELCGTATLPNVLALLPTWLATDP